MFQKASFRPQGMGYGKLVLRSPQSAQSKGFHPNCANFEGMGHWQGCDGQYYAFTKTFLWEFSGMGPSANPLVKTDGCCIFKEMINLAIQRENMATTPR